EGSQMRKACAAGVLALVAVLIQAPAAPAITVTIGSVAPSGHPGGGCSGCHVLQAATAPSSPSYVVPAAPVTGPWTITSWSSRGGSTGAGTGSIEVWRPTGTPNEFRLIAIGPEQAFPMDTVISYPVSVPVQPGDHLGARSLAGAYLGLFPTSSAADVEV